MKTKTGIRREYDEKIIGSRQSSDKLYHRKLRRFAIIMWFIACIVIGIAVYMIYAKNTMPDDPEEIVNTTKVETGIELSEDADFGPWMASQKNTSK
ncbi:MAG: hypothetical protein IKR27_06960 [Lachnospiraceae bacterium]|nr:hypothetical protein [Lachnospiraceae bacterium]MBR6274725.1 hypothetical protein [Lachnospiraceae bacterium]